MTEKNPKREDLRPNGGFEAKTGDLKIKRGTEERNGGIYARTGDRPIEREVRRPFGRFRDETGGPADRSGAEPPDSAGRLGRAHRTALRLL